MPEKIPTAIDPELARYMTATPEAALRAAQSRFEGLNPDEVLKARAGHGWNEISAKPQVPVIKKIIRKFLSPLIIILLVTGSLSLFFGDRRSAIVIYLMIFLSVILDFVQEHKSEKAAEKLKEKVVTKVEVSRQGRRELILARELVPGDIIHLSVGSIVPADARVLSGDDFFVNESSLTGEAFPVSKEPEALPQAVSGLAERKNLVFLGTNVVSGYALALVIATGPKTVFGGIAKELTVAPEETDFERGVRNFGYLITKVILVLVSLIFILNSLVARHNLLDSFMFSLALAVGLTPELLPMIMSITLARGSLNMSRHGVIVKRLNSIHDFGSMDVLCTDKTGTLTENAIKLIKHVDIFGQPSEKLLRYAFLNSYYQSGIDNPLDEALKNTAALAEPEQYAKIDEVPFDFIRRRLSVVVEKDNQRLLISKGAPEEIFEVCARFEDGHEGLLSPGEREQAFKYYKELSADGFRVLAIAYRELPIDGPHDYKVDAETDLILLGFVAFLDPAKANAKEAIDLLEGQGIEVKIITGDNDLVTKKICSLVDVNVKGIMTGTDIDQLDNAALQVRVEQTTIFARVSPIQKNRIVAMLRANGHSVGYMGDGINDALPLKTADVGISVNNGVDVAKEAADMILLTKDLKVLSLGVTEGRRTFANTLKYILMGLSSNFGNMFSVAVASFALPFLPMLPLQILLNNFLYDFSQVTIPSDRVDPEYTLRPQRWSMSLIRRFMLLFGPISSIFDLTTYAAMYFIFHANATLFQTGWFLESFATQTLVIFIIRTRRAPFWRSRPSWALLGTVVGFVALAMYIPFSPIAEYFSFTAPSWRVMAAIWGIVAVYLALTEMAKIWLYRRYFNKQ